MMDQCLAADHAGVEPRFPPRGAHGGGLLAVRGILRGNDAEVGQLQARDHVAENHPCRGQGGGLHDAGPQFVADGLPVEATEFRIPVVVVDEAPYPFKRREIELLEVRFSRWSGAT